jgi:hypothetical protein
MKQLVFVVHKLLFLSLCFALVKSELFSIVQKLTFNPTAVYVLTIRWNWIHVCRIVAKAE